jgi:hypothetical protein
MDILFTIFIREPGLLIIATIGYSIINRSI